MLFAELQTEVPRTECYERSVGPCGDDREKPSNVASPLAHSAEDVYCDELDGELGSQAWPAAVLDPEGVC